MDRVRIGMVTFDQAKGAAVITLVGDTRDRALPLLIGIAEGLAIVRELNRTPTARPMVYDLFQNFLDGTKTNIEKVVLDRLEDETFFARIYFDVNGTPLVTDSRPSDAIVLALKKLAPIYVSPEVMTHAEQLGVADTEEEDLEETKVREWLENLKPEDFGKEHE